MQLVFTAKKNAKDFSEIISAWKRVVGYNKNMNRIRVGVLRGGISDEYDVSLLSGASILANLPGERYEAIDILVAKDGTWHLRGRPVSPEDLIDVVDIIWNALHGFYGEDGQVQKILDDVRIPYIGSEVQASILSMNKCSTKSVCKNILEELGVHVPKHFEIDEKYMQKNEQIKITAQNLAKRIQQEIPPLWLCKPRNGGSSIGIVLCRSYPQLVAVIETYLEAGLALLVEEFILGREASVVVMDEFRNQKPYVFPAIEITKTSSTPWSYEEKYCSINSVDYVCPSRFGLADKELLMKAAASVHNALGLKHYSRHDFLMRTKKVANKGKQDRLLSGQPSGRSNNQPVSEIYFLEANSLPGLTEHSLLPKSLEAVGATLPQFLDSILKQRMKEFLDKAASRNVDKE